MDQVKSKVKEYSLALFDDQLPSKYDSLALMVIERAKAYLNRDDIPIILSSTLAEIIFDRCNSLSKAKESVISSVSDNGQSVSYDNNPVAAFSFSSDSELFGNHSSILNRYRKIGVIKPKKDDVNADT